MRGGKAQEDLFLFLSTQPSVYFLLPRRALSGLTGDSRWKPESAAAQRSPNKENEVFFYDGQGRLLRQDPPQELCPP